jgi:hypothetical protein
MCTCRYPAVIAVVLETGPELHRIAQRILGWCVNGELGRRSTESVLAYCKILFQQLHLPGGNDELHENHVRIICLQGMFNTRPRCVMICKLKNKVHMYKQTGIISEILQNTKNENQCCIFKCTCTCMQSCFSSVVCSLMTNHSQIGYSMYSTNCACYCQYFSISISRVQCLEFYSTTNISITVYKHFFHCQWHNEKRIFYKPVTRFHTSTQK